MATLLHRIGRLAFRRRGLAVLLWVVVLGAVGAAAVSTTSTSTTGLTLPGTESQRAIDLLDEKFPAVNADGASATIVLRAPDGQDIGDAGPKKAVTATLKEIRDSSSRITDVTRAPATPSPWPARAAPRRSSASRWPGSSWSSPSAHWPPRACRWSPRCLGSA
nr:MMPL family transporter [Streptomyces niphimycinicus]